MTGQRLPMNGPYHNEKGLLTIARGILNSNMYEFLIMNVIDLHECFLDEWKLNCMMVNSYDRKDRTYLGFQRIVRSVFGH